MILVNLVCFILLAQARIYAMYIYVSVKDKDLWVRLPKKDSAAVGDLKKEIKERLNKSDLKEEESILKKVGYAGSPLFCSAGGEILDDSVKLEAGGGWVSYPHIHTNSKIIEYQGPDDVSRSVVACKKETIKHFLIRQGLENARKFGDSKTNMDDLSFVHASETVAVTDGPKVLFDEALSDKEAAEDVVRLFKGTEFESKFMGSIVLCRRGGEVTPTLSDETKRVFVSSSAGLREEPVCENETYMDLLRRLYNQDAQRMQVEVTTKLNSHISASLKLGSETFQGKLKKAIKICGEGDFIYKICDTPQEKLRYEGVAPGSVKTAGELRRIIKEHYRAADDETLSGERSPSELTDIVPLCSSAGDELEDGDALAVSSHRLISTGKELEVNLRDGSKETTFRVSVCERSSVGRVIELIKKHLGDAGKDKKVLFALDDWTTGSPNYKEVEDTKKRYADVILRKFALSSRVWAKVENITASPQQTPQESVSVNETSAPDVPSQHLPTPENPDTLSVEESVSHPPELSPTEHPQPRSVVQPLSSSAGTPLNITRVDSPVPSSEARLQPVSTATQSLQTPQISGAPSLPPKSDDALFQLPSVPTSRSSSESLHIPPLPPKPGSSSQLMAQLPPVPTSRPAAATRPSPPPDQRSVVSSLPPISDSTPSQLPPVPASQPSAAAQSHNVQPQGQSNAVTAAPTTATAAPGTRIWTTLGGILGTGNRPPNVKPPSRTMLPPFPKILLPRIEKKDSEKQLSLMRTVKTETFEDARKKLLLDRLKEHAGPFFSVVLNMFLFSGIFYALVRAYSWWQHGRLVV